MRAKEQCNKILQECHKLGFEEEIAEGPLKNIIMNVRGVIDDRAVTNWIKALIVFEFLEWKSPHVYKINRKEN